MSPSILLPLLVAPASVRTQTSPDVLAITHAAIETGAGPAIPSGTILIRQGKIAAVGASVAVPAGAMVVDVKGMRVYPGFVNAYTSDGLKLPDAPSSPTAPDARNTAPASMFHGNRKGIRVDVVAAKCLAVKDELAANYAQGITTALISSGTGSIRGIAAVVDYTPSGTVVLPSAGAELSFRGGGGGAGYPGTLFGVVANLRQWLADAQFYVAQNDPKKDTGFENLRPLVTGQEPAFFAVDSAREIVRAARIADEFKFQMIVVGGREAYRDIDLLESKSIPVVVDIDPGLEPSLKMETSVTAVPQAVLDERHATWIEHTLNAQKLDAAGIRYAFSAGNTGLHDYLKNVRKLVAAGLPPPAALRAMTFGAAQLLGVGDKLGTIEVGKLANLVVMSGDFADEKSEVQSVVVEGVVTDVKQGAKK